MIDLQDIWTLRQTEFDDFAALSGDDNPIHVDPEFCARTAFGRTVSHGMLIYTKLWGLLRRKRPALVALDQSLMFPNPAFVGDQLRLIVLQGAPDHLLMRATRLSDDAECLTGEVVIKC